MIYCVSDDVNQGIVNLLNHPFVYFCFSAMDFKIDGFAYSARQIPNQTRHSIEKLTYGKHTKLHDPFL